MIIKKLMFQSPNMVYGLNNVVSITFPTIAQS